MYLKPSLSSVLKLSVCLTISQFAGLSAMAQTKAIAAALKTKNSQKVAQYRPLQIKQVAAPGSTSSFNERIRGGAIIRKKQQLEFLDIPNEGEFRYSLGIGGKYSSQNQSIEMGPIKADVQGEEKGYLVNTRFAYGLSEIFALQAMIDYAESERESKSNSTMVSDDKTSSKGPSEPTLGLIAKMELSQVTTILQLNAKIKTGDSESSRTEVGPMNNKRESNRLSGGTSFTPSLLIHSNSNPNVIFGGEIAYTIQNNTSSQSKDYYADANAVRVTNSEYKGANAGTITLHNEYRVGTSSSIGGNLSFTRIEPRTDVKFDERIEGIDLLRASLYTVFKPSRTISIAPIFNYMTITKRSLGISTVNQYDDYTGQIRTTFTF